MTHQIRERIWKVYRYTIFITTVCITFLLYMILTHTKGGEFPILLGLLCIGYWYAEIDKKVWLRSRINRYIEEESMRGMTSKERMLSYQVEEYKERLSIVEWKAKQQRYIIESLRKELSNVKARNRNQHNTIHPKS